MTARINFQEYSPELTKKLMELGQAVQASTLDKALVDLVQIRASQINGCSFCLDMHVKEATIHGERALRLHHVAVWPESNLFSDKERAALAWTESVTLLAETGVPDEAFERVRAHFSEREVAELTFAVALINTWNRLAVSMRVVPGSMDKMMGLDKAQLN